MPLAEGVVWVGEFGLSEASSLAFLRGFCQGGGVETYGRSSKRPTVGHIDDLP